jgi:hypothetical protein
MPTIRDYEKQYRAQGYTTAQARSLARRQRAEDVASERQRKEDFNAAYAASQERIKRLRRDRDFKNPTNTEYPGNGWPHPRSKRATYDAGTQVLRIWWDRPSKAGNLTDYYDVPPQVWETVKETSSTGKYVNAVLNYYPYETKWVR